jgi:hypothetical protein
VTRAPQMALAVGVVCLLAGCSPECSTVCRRTEYGAEVLDCGAPVPDVYLDCDNPDLTEEQVRACASCGS